MSRCVDARLSSLEGCAGSDIAANIGDLCEVFPLEVIIRCLMGVETESQKGRTNDEQELKRRIASRWTAIISGKFRILLGKYAS